MQSFAPLQINSIPSPSCTSAEHSYQEATVSGHVQVAILCNHQRAVPKGHAGQMERLSERMHKLNEELLELQHELKAAQKGKAYGDKKRRDPERCVLQQLVPAAVLRRVTAILYV